MSAKGVSAESLEAIALTMVGENGLAPYMSGPDILVFFDKFGVGGDYPGFGTRRLEALERLTRLQGSDELDRALEAAFDPRRFLGTEFSVEAAVDHVNQYLRYDGLEFVKDGLYYRLRSLPEVIPAVMAPLLDTPIPPSTPKKVVDKLRRAVAQFTSDGATLEDRHEAVRNLADVLEYLRPEAKKFLHNKDERDLFELANNFGIRHHGKGQKTEYEPVIWLSWMFYYYLATIHALLRLIHRSMPEAEATE